jgi:predicted transcriptional regulator
VVKRHRLVPETPSKSANKVENATVVTASNSARVIVSDESTECLKRHCLESPLPGFIRTATASAGTVPIVEPTPPQKNRKKAPAVPVKKSVQTAQPFAYDDEVAQRNIKNLELITQLEEMNKESSVMYSNIYQVLDEVKSKSGEPVLKDKKSSAFGDSMTVVFVLAAVFLHVFQLPVLPFLVCLAIIPQTSRIYSVGKDLLPKLLLGAGYRRSHTVLLKFFHFCDKKFEDFSTIAEKIGTEPPPTVNMSTGFDPKSWDRQTQHVLGYRFDWNRLDCFKYNQ